MIKFIKALGILCLIITITLSILFIKHFHFPPQHQSQFPTYENWDNGSVNHILPLADHQQLLLKTSFKEPLTKPPLLLIGANVIEGTASDPNQRFWQFYTDNLEANRDYILTLLSADDEPLADSWHLKTFPHPDSSVEAMTILAYTCAGGTEEKVLGKEIFIKTKMRQALLQKGLSFDPDIVIANGDHIYWDRKSLDLSKMRSLLKLRLDNIYGQLDLEQPMLSPANYETFTRICDAQIAELYGCLLRSKPVYFLSDDHDLFENDEAKPELVTLPPQPYMLDGATATQQLYYPEFLPQRHKPNDLKDSKNGFSRTYGSFRYGTLVEGLLYDCKRNTSLEGDSAVLVTSEAEQWIINRTTSSDAQTLFHIPSSPVAWTAGKWSEWYPDVFQADGAIGKGATKKYKWQEGWWKQHQRILGSFKNNRRTPLILQGDLHVISYGSILQSGDIDFSDNPIQVVGTGPLGSGDFGFPSAFRGTGAVVPDDMEVEELQPPLEKNGFTIITVTKENIKLSIYGWRPDEGLEAIDDLQPIFEQIIPITNDALKK